VSKKESHPIFPEVVVDEGAVEKEATSTFPLCTSRQTIWFGPEAYHQEFRIGTLSNDKLRVEYMMTRGKVEGFHFFGKNV